MDNNRLMAMCRCQGVANTQIQAGLSPDAEWLLQAVSAFWQSQGWGQPLVLSICRSSAAQSELRRRWDSGDKRGIRVRPALRSAHTPDNFGRCNAFDLAGTEDQLNQTGRFVNELRGDGFRTVRWGGNWLVKDPNHFDTRG